jgi:hypothetical protein
MRDDSELPWRNPDGTRQTLQISSRRDGCQRSSGICRYRSRVMPQALVSYSGTSADENRMAQQK